MVNGSAAYQHRDTIMEIEVDFYRLVLVIDTSCQLPVPARSNRLQLDHCRLQWDHCSLTNSEAGNTCLKQKAVFLPCFRAWKHMSVSEDYSYYERSKIAVFTDPVPSDAHDVMERLLSSFLTNH